jgi:hypothetical protein
MQFKVMVFMLVTAGEFSKLPTATFSSETPQLQETHHTDSLLVEQIPSVPHEHDKKHPYNEQI